MRRWIVLWMMVTSAISYAQTDQATDSILTTKKLRPGVYLNVNEFKTNSPSVKENYSTYLNPGQFDFAFLYKVDPKGKRDYYSEAFGFCDGTDVFINAKSYNADNNFFARLLILGPICYLEDDQQKLVPVAQKVNVPRLSGSVLERTTSIEEIAKRNNPGWIIYVPDDDGQPYALSHKTLASIFKEYGAEELSSKLKSEKNRYDVSILLKYVKDFNRLAR